ncbi:MAG: VOC family protein [Hyphomonadaceae bacterium]
MDATVTPFLMFEGDAEEAVSLYVSLVPNSRIEHIERYGPEGPGRDGTAMRLDFTLAGVKCRATDSYVSHKFGFTPSLSLFVDLPDEAAFEEVYTALSYLGRVLMSPAAYPFARRFAWFDDRFGVSWQLSVA